MKILLDNIELVGAENIASDEHTQAAVYQSIAQGSQGWGVNATTAVILRLAQELDNAQKLAETADENHRKLKGVQMELGRVKKSNEGLRAEVKQLQTQVVKLTLDSD